MNKSLVVALLFGMLSQAEAVRISNSENKEANPSNVHQIHLELMQSQKKAAEAKERNNKTLAKINELKQKLGDKKPVESNMI